MRLILKETSILRITQFIFCYQFRRYRSQNCKRCSVESLYCHCCKQHLVRKFDICMNIKHEGLFSGFTYSMCFEVFMSICCAENLILALQSLTIGKFEKNRIFIIHMYVLIQVYVRFNRNCSHVCMYDDNTYQGTYPETFLRSCSTERLRFCWHLISVLIPNRAI